MKCTKFFVSKNMKRALVISISVLLLLCAIFGSCYFSGYLEAQKLYKTLFDRLDDLISQRERIFDTLIFRMASQKDQIFKGTHLKFVLKDQFGEKWVFKPSACDEKKRASAACQIYTMYGLDCADIYIEELTINGKRCVGQMIKFIDGSRQLKSWDEVPTELLTEVYKKLMVDFLIANADIHMGNLLFRKHRNVDTLFSIDFDASFRQYDSCNEYKKVCMERGVFTVFEQINSEGDDYAIGDVSTFANVIHNTPDGIIRLLMSRKKFSKEAIDATLERKKNVKCYLKEIYLDQNTFFQKLSKYFYLNRYLREHIAFLEDSRTNQGESEVNEEAFASKQSEITVSTSVAAWKIVFPYYLSGELSLSSLVTIREKINLLYQKEKNISERVGLKRYLEIIDEAIQDNTADMKELYSLLLRFNTANERIR
jgi:hypothetical protein